tara:strand:+ start:129 stop:998 length:870 start_codon:yes stop_codon:yes gene_type:complete
MALPAVIGGIGKGLLGLGKGLSKGMTAGKVAKTAGTIVGRKAKNKISAPRQDTSQTISPSYYEDPKKQSIFKRTASDGSIESVKITVTNIKSVLFKQQKQLTKQSKDNQNLEERLSDLGQKKSKGMKLGLGKVKNAVMSMEPITDFINNVSSISSLLLTSVIGNSIFDMLEGGTETGTGTTPTDKIIDESVEKVGKEKTLELLNQEQKEKKKKGNIFTRFFNRVIRGEGAELEEQKARVKTGETPRYGFFGRIKSESELKNLNDTSLIDNDNEVTNTLIINRPIEVPAK